MKKKVIIIIVAIIVVLAGAFTTLSLLHPSWWPFFKPASENFSLQAKKLFKSNETEISYDEYSKALNSLKATDSSTTAELNLSMNISVPTSMISRANQQLINSSKLKLASSYDATSKTSLISMGLLKNNSSIVSIDALADKTSIAIKSDELTDKKFVKFDLSKFEEFAKTNNLNLDEKGKESIDSLLKLLQDETSNKLLYDLLYISENDYNEIKKSHSDTLTKYIDKKNYTSKKVKTSVNGDDVKTDAYSLVLDGNDAYEYLKQCIEAYKNDSTLKKLLINKTDTIGKYFENLASNLSTSSNKIDLDDMPKISEEDYDKFFDELLKGLEESKSDFTSLKECLKITIYSLKKEPVKMDIAILNDKKDKEGSVIFTEELGKNKNTYTIDIKKLMSLAGSASTYEEDSFDTDDDDDDEQDYVQDMARASVRSAGDNTRTTSTKSSTNPAAALEMLDKIIITDKFEKSNDSRKGTITASIKASGQSQDILDIDYDYENSKSTQKIKIEVKPSSTLTALLGNQSMSFSIDSEVSGLDTDTQNIKCEMGVKFGTYSGKISLDGKISKTANVPTLNSSNSYDLFAMTKEDFQKTITEIGNNISTKLPGIVSKYGITIPNNKITLPTTTTIPDLTTPSTNTNTGNLTTEQAEAIKKAQDAIKAAQDAQSTGNTSAAQAAAQDALNSAIKNAQSQGISVPGM